jgi:hypothetical protein
MSNLNANLLPLRVRKVDMSLEPFNVGIEIYAQVFGSYTSVGLNTRHFDKSQTWTSLHDATQVRIMPWRIEAIKCRVLTHGADEDAILKSHTAYRQWLK